MEEGEQPEKKSRLDCDHSGVVPLSAVSELPKNVGLVWKFPGSIKLFILGMFLKLFMIESSSQVSRTVEILEKINRSLSNVV